MMNTDKPILILASSSPTRRRLMEEAGLKFEVIPNDFKEDMNLPLPPRELAIRLAIGKAEAVAKKLKEAVVIGADTFVVFEGKIIGKPHTPEKATETLKMLNGKAHIIISGLTVIYGDKSISKAVETKVFFRNLSDNEINDYVATGEPLEKAGSYAIMENGWKFVDRIEGSKTNVSGLPTEELLNILKELN